MERPGLFLLFGASAIVFCATVFLCGCGGRTKSAAKPPETISFFALDTHVSLSAHGDKAAEAVQAARQLIERCEEKWSVTDSRSELYAVNHGGGIRRTVSDETARLIAYALGMARETDGALDPTVYPVLLAWGFTTGKYAVPSDERIRALLPFVGFEKILLDGNDITVPDGMQLDLGAVAKGYIGDLVVDCLRGYSIESAIVNLGGNVQLIGRKDDGSDWNIGIRSPFGDGAFASVRLDGQAIVTSGGYQRNFTDADGNVYHHIMN
ncbi:MAG: FAD:protein FMN transferase, partial [Treponemataceae bacterium]|nr:FAD:protein FMN transferase [Treponemataceae bacterium]